MKKLLVYALIFAMVLSLCAPAMAEEYASLVLDEAVSVTVDGGSPRRFAFVPQEAGGYRFYSFDLEGDAYGRILDADFCTLAEDDDGAGDGNFSVVAILEAGELYYLEADTYSGIASYQCVVSKLPPASGMTLSETEYTGYVGRGFTLYSEFTPENSAPETVTWTSSHEAVATVDDWGWVSFHSVGTAVITGTSERGFTAQCRVTVKDYQKLTCGSGTAGDLTQEDGFVFTPETDGTYVFWDEQQTQDHYSWYAYIQDSDGNHLNGMDASNDYPMKLFCTLKAGETYYLYVYHSNSDQSSYRIWVDRAEPAQSMTVSAFKTSGYPGEWISLYYAFQPELAIPEKITWTTSNKAVVDLMPEVWNDQEVYSAVLRGVGTAVITATSESGLTASCEITVKEPPEVTVGQRFNDGMVKFVPDEAGCYAIYAYEGYLDLWSAVCDEALQELDAKEGVWCDPEGTMIFAPYLEAGKIYYWKTGTHYETDEQYTLEIKKTVPASGMFLEQAAVSGYPGEGHSLEPVFTPVGCAPENVTWTSSNETVATVDDLGWVYFHSVGTATITATSEKGLTATCTVTVEDYPTLECAVPVELDPLDGDAWFRFIPKTSGWYSFWAPVEEGEDVTARGELFDEGWNSLGFANRGGENGGFHLSAQLTAGKTYYLQCDFWSYSHGDYYALRVDPAGPCQELSLSQDGLRGWSGDGFELDYTLSPLPCATGAISWSSSDESVVQVDPWGEVELMAPGTATVTVSTENGLSDSCIVTVKEPQTLICNGGIQADSIDGKCCVTFTPDQPGAYGLWITGSSEDIDGYAYLMGEDSQYISPSQSAIWDLEAGETYSMEVIAYNSVEDYQIWIAPVREATGMTLSESQVFGYPTNWVYLDAIFQPWPAIPQEVTWTVSDETVVRIYDNGDIIFLKPGTVTVMATSESGFTANCTVTSIDPPEMVCGQWTTTSIHNRYPLKFTPREDGHYRFSINMDGYVGLGITDEEGDFLGMTDSSGVCFAYLKAGKTYYVDDYSGDDGPGTEYSVLPEKVQAPTALVPESEKFTLYVGEDDYLSVEFAPEGTGGERVFWSTEDTEIVELDPEGGYRTLAVGTAKVTGVSENGLTTTVIIHVLPAPEGLSSDEYGSCGPNLLWQQAGDGTLTIAGSGQISAWEFNYRTNIRRILFPQGLTGIGKGAFSACEKLTELTIPASVTCIDERAFVGCKRLQSIRFLGSAPEIGEDAFGNVTATVYYPAGDPSWTEAVRQSYGGELTWVAYDPDAGVRVGGSAPEGAALVLTRADNGQTVANVTAQSGAYALEGVLPGEYVLTASKENHVTRSWAVSVGLEEVQLDAVICLRGDVSGDGRINVGDVARIYAHAKKTTLLTDDYLLSCADVSGDGRINVGDAARVYAHAKKTTSLW